MVMIATAQCVFDIPQPSPEPARALGRRVATQPLGADPASLLQELRQDLSGLQPPSDESSTLDDEQVLMNVQQQVNYLLAQRGIQQVQRQPARYL